MILLILQVAADGFSTVKTVPKVQQLISHHFGYSDLSFMRKRYCYLPHMEFVLIMSDKFLT